MPKIINQIKANKNTKYIVLFTSMLCILAMEPYIIWFLTDNLRFLALIVIFFIVRGFRGKLPIATLWGIVVFCYVLGFCFNNLTQLYSPLIVEVLFLVFLPLINDFELNKIYETVVSILAVVYLLGIPFYLIDKVVTLPFFTIPGRNPALVQTYKNYIVFVQAVQDIDLFPRFRSVFDEAGVVGTISVLLLTGNKYRLNSWKYVVILIGGIVSFSFFFYASSLIIFFLFNMSNKKTLISGIIVIISLFVVFQNNEVISTLIIDRFVLSDNGIAGDNRTTDEWNVYYGHYLKTSSALTGKGSGMYDAKKFPYVASYQTFVYEYGIIGGVLVLIYYLLLGVRRISFKDNFILLIALMLCFYQRPWAFTYYYPILAAGIIGRFALLTQKGNAKELNVRRKQRKLSMAINE